MIYIARDNRQQVKVSNKRMKYVMNKNRNADYWDISDGFSLAFLWLQNDDFPQVKKGEQWTLDTDTLAMERIEAHE